MKPQYERRYRNWEWAGRKIGPYRNRIVCLDNDWCCEHRWSYYRPIRTTQERCLREADRVDFRNNGVRLKQRGRRAGEHLCGWNLERRVSRSGGRSWKDFTRHRKQWMRVGHLHSS